MLDATEAIHSQRNQVCANGVHELWRVEVAEANSHSKALQYNSNC